MRSPLTRLRAAFRWLSNALFVTFMVAATALVLHESFMSGGRLSESTKKLAESIAVIAVLLAFEPWLPLLEPRDDDPLP